VLGKVAVPQILAEVLMALVLVVFAFWRMTAVGVNLAGIVTTSAVVTGVLAFSLQETLGNLWGGIQLQLDNTCRIGDWIHVDTVMGQVVDIRWRYVAVATNSGETVIIPNGSLSKSRVMVLSRRGDKRIPWRREVEFGVAYEIPPARVIAAVEAALKRAEIPNVAASPQLDVLCRDFGESSYQYVVRYWLTDLVQDTWTDSQVRLHVAATLARQRMEIPIRIACWSGRKQQIRARASLAERLATSRSSISVHAVDERRARGARRRSRRLSIRRPRRDRAAGWGKLADSLRPPAAASPRVRRQRGGTACATGLPRSRHRRISARWGCSLARLAARPSSPRRKCCAIACRRPRSTRFSMPARNSWKRSRKWSQRARPPTMPSCSRCPPTPARVRRSAAARISSAGSRASSR
jgi:hypothetical protein